VFALKRSERRFACLLLVAALCVPLAGATAPAGGAQRAGDRQLGRQNTWSARSASGQVLTGTWTGGFDPKTGAASGSWTLLDPTGRAAARGGWSAIKSATGWNGSWRANVVGSAGEFSGSWSVTAALKPDAAFTDLFALALQNVVSGTWRAGPGSGSWSIRAFASE